MTNNTAANKQHVYVVREFQCFRFYKEPIVAGLVLEVLQEDIAVNHRDQVETYNLNPGHAWRQGRHVDEACIGVTTDRDSEPGFYIVHMFDVAYYVYHHHDDAQEALNTAKEMWEQYIREWVPDESTPDDLQDIADRIKVDHVLSGVPWTYHEQPEIYLRGHEPIPPP